MRIAPVVDLGVAADTLNRGFADYFVPLRFDAAALETMARTDSVDFTLSRMAFVDDEPAAVALVARRGTVSRLAGMAIAPDARGKKLGRALVDLLLAEATARGDREMLLEVIEQNEPAVRLYESCGFERIRRLVGFEGSLRAAGADPPERISAADFAALVTDDSHLPWQLSAATLAELEPAHVGLRLGPSALLMTNPASPGIAIRAVATERAARRRGMALALLSAAAQHYPGKNWRVSALCPEELAGLFLRAGLARGALSQWQMRRSLG